MRAKNIEKFLSDQHDMPTELRNTILRLHTGRWPSWHAHSLARCVNQVVEVATEHRSKAERFAVLCWYWNDTGAIGITMKSCDTLREAREHKERIFSIDAARADLRA